MKITQTFYQESQPECGIPAHWCVQYFTEGNGFPQYEYFNTENEADKWVEENTLLE